MLGCLLEIIESQEGMRQAAIYKEGFFRCRFVLASKGFVVDYYINSFRVKN